MRVFLFMPSYDGRAYLDAAMAFFNASLDDNGLRLLPQTATGSILEGTFNTGWAECLDLYEAGKIDAFAMQHPDVAPPPGWLDVLERERLAAGVDLIAAAIPIKDDRGISSTAVDDTGDPWAPRRLSQKQLAELPPVFTSEDVGGPLLCNTGLWLARLGPWCLDVLFQTHSTIRKLPDETGRLRRRSSVQSEDWDFSRQLHARGVKLAATTLVPNLHHGDYPFDSEALWGWDEDEQNDPAARRRKEERRQHERQAIAARSAEHSAAAEEQGA